MRDLVERAIDDVLEERSESEPEVVALQLGEDLELATEPASRYRHEWLVSDLTVDVEAWR